MTAGLLTWQQLMGQQVGKQGALIRLQEAGNKDGQLRVCQLMHAHPDRILEVAPCGTWRNMLKSSISLLSGRHLHTCAQ